jgi:hypothetical protein
VEHRGGMSRAIREFWARAGLQEPVFTFDETRCWSQRDFELLERTGLLRETGQARFVVCDACTDHHWEEVVWMPSVRTPSGMRGYIPCPEEGSVPVDPERLRQWAVDLGRLADAIARSMDLSGSVEPLNGGRILALGRRHLKGRFREFFLMAAAHREDAAALVQCTDRIANAISPVLMVPHGTPPNREWGNPKTMVFDLSVLAAISEDGLQIDLDYIEDALPGDRPSVKCERSIAVPDSSRWEDLVMEVGEASVVFRLGDFCRESSIEELRFSDERTDRAAGDAGWRVLRLFAQQNGVLTLKDTGSRKVETERLKKQIRNLRQRLQTILPIQGNPIRFQRAFDRYECVFSIRAEGEFGVSVPYGTTWPDVRITDIGGGRIELTVKTREAFAASTDGADGRRQREAAERTVSSVREFPLESMGLARHNGQVTDEGRALLALLQGGGRLNRKADDFAVLRLAERLRRWTDMDAEPLRFLVAEGDWVARFECDSRVRRP